ncbi:hypothetical protein OH76DRAFT_634229 [Lentinus brumalis]|uniref:Uncharacterized protein n=1 Tax=Lentinus brumalis TaxID=2498619 RepID=A0A371D8J4_9APHY|nr:hypothetical protein OH76DRAFT_634229 [Polyporus brumalis]
MLHFYLGDHLPRGPRSQATVLQNLGEEPNTRSADDSGPGDWGAAELASRFKSSSFYYIAIPNRFQAELPRMVLGRRPDHVFRGFECLLVVPSFCHSLYNRQYPGMSHNLSVPRPRTVSRRLDGGRTQRKKCPTPTLQIWRSAIYHLSHRFLFARSGLEDETWRVYAGSDRPGSDSSSRDGAARSVVAHSVLRVLPCYITRLSCPPCRPSSSPPPSHLS